MSRDVNVLYDMHTTLTEVIARSLREIITAYTDECNRQLWTMANAFVTRYDRNRPLRITLPSTVRLDVIATREYSLVPSRVHPTIRVFFPIPLTRYNFQGILYVKLELPRVMLSPT